MIAGWIGQLDRRIECELKERKHRRLLMVGCFTMWHGDRFGGEKSGQRRLKAAQ